MPEHLVALVNRFATPSAFLGDIRDVCFCLLSFAVFFFLRFDELSRLRWSDISFFQDHIELYVSKSKTDQLGKGCTLVIASTGTPTCPCAMLLRYAALAKRNLDSLEFVFKNLSFSTLRVIPFVPARVCLTPGQGKLFWLSSVPSVLIRHG